MVEITLTTLINEVAKEVPQDYIKRTDFLTDLQNVIEQDALRPAMAYNVGFEHLKMVITKYINVPALDWQKKIFNLVAALNQ